MLDAKVYPKRGPNALSEEMTPMEASPGKEAGTNGFRCQVSAVQFLLLINVLLPLHLTVKLLLIFQCLTPITP